MTQKTQKNVRELADFAKLPPARQKQIMKKVISAAVDLQKETIRKADSLSR